MGIFLCVRFFILKLFDGEVLLCFLPSANQIKKKSKIYLEARQVWGSSTADQRPSPLRAPQTRRWQLSDVSRISVASKSYIFPRKMADRSLSVRPCQRCPKLSAPNEVK